MIFLYNKWEAFCKKLYQNNIQSIRANQVLNEADQYIVLKHDVETNPKKALKIAHIEAKYGHCGSYYVQAYLLNSPKNIDVLKQIKQLGHEVSYHYDVLDSSRGDIEKAIVEFENNKKLFEDNGFILETLCQHGNPIIERVGYTSNRDFFRDEKVKALYPKLSDIMVDFKEKYSTDYVYISDAGRKFKHIYDPINNDIINSDDKNIVYDDLERVLAEIKTTKNNYIISIHPHRWQKLAAPYLIKLCFFKVAKAAARLMAKIPFLKKL